MDVAAIAVLVGAAVAIGVAEAIGVAHLGRRTAARGYRPDPSCCRLQHIKTIDG